MRKKRIEIDGHFYRKRRGVIVEIPTEWVGVVPHPQTMNKKRKARQNNGRRTRRLKNKST